MKPLTCIFTVGLQNHIRQDTLYLDVRPERHELRRNLHVLPLPLRQFRLVQALMANHPTPMTHWELFYHVWGEGTINQWGEVCTMDEDGGPLHPNGCIEQLARKLRIKLAPLGLSIEAPRKGYGYQLLEKETTCEEEAQTTADTSSQEAEGEVRLPLPPTYSPRGKAKQVLKPVDGPAIGSLSGDHPSGITLTIEPCRVRR